MGRPRQQKTPEQFWANVTILGPKDCWPFNGTLDRDGYGKFWMRPEGLAHRVAYSLTNGAILEKKQVLHSCDTPRCCNPGHLFLGTPETNMQDMWDKNRHARPTGEKNNHAKLKTEDVIEIRRLYSAGATQVALAKRFSVGQVNISAIVRRETWKDV